MSETSRPGGAHHAVRLRPPGTRARPEYAAGGRIPPAVPAAPPSARRPGGERAERDRTGDALAGVPGDGRGRAHRQRRLAGEDRRRAARHAAAGGQVAAGRELHAAGAGAADQRRPGQGRGARGVLAGLPALLRARALPQGWTKSKPAYVEFVRVPVMWQAVHRSHAQLYYTLEALGRQDLVAKAFDDHGAAARHAVHAAAPTRLLQGCSSSWRCATASAPTTSPRPTTPSP